jgi:tetratricopeptide (TPR) repeat protein
VNKTSNIFFTAPQRNVEYARSEYIGAIDILNEAEKTTVEVRDIRTAMIEHYRNSNPKLMKGLDNISNELSNIAYSAAQIVNTTSDILQEVELVNRNLIQIEATLDAGFELISVQLDEGNRLLRDLVRILSTPIGTQATEYLNRAKAYLRDGFFEEAEEDFRKVTELDQGSYSAWYLIGLIRRQSAGDRDGALVAFEKCNRFASVRSKHYYSKSLFQQAFLYHHVDNSEEEAIATLMLSIEAEVENYQSHFFLAELLATSGKLEEATHHLKLCVNIDAIYFLNSSSSKALVNSGVHDAYFDEQAATLNSINRSLSKLLESSNSLNSEISNWSDSAIGLGTISENFVSLESATLESDYLAQRELRRIGSELSGALQSNISTNNQWISNHVEAARKKMEVDTSTAKNKIKTEILDKQTIVTLVAAIFFGGGMVFWMLAEIVVTFQKDILAGIAATILIVFFGVVFLAIAAACWAAFSGVLVGLLSLFGKLKSNTLQSKIRAEGEKEIASRDESSKRFIKQLDQLKTALERF